MPSVSWAAAAAALAAAIRADDEEADEDEVAAATAEFPALLPLRRRDRRFDFFPFRDLPLLSSPDSDELESPSGAAVGCDDGLTEYSPGLRTRSARGSPVLSTHMYWMSKAPSARIAGMPTIAMKTSM